MKTEIEANLANPSPDPDEHGRFRRDGVPPGRTQHFPWSELEAAASARLGPHWTVYELADLIGMNWRSVRRWRATGRVPARRSDRVACRLGLHPMLVFSGWEAWADRTMGVISDDVTTRRGRG